MVSAALERDSRILCVTAPNPSAMTLEGTNSYLVFGSRGSCIAIDPGPAIPRHIETLVERATAHGARIGAIAVTHGHPDHAPGAALLAARTGATVYAHSSARFPHDVAVDGELLRAEIAVDDVLLEAIHVPGHSRDHLAFYEPEERALFTGDVVIGHGTVVVAPPGGDMRAYQRSLGRLRDEFGAAATIRGGHGKRIDDPRAKLDEYIAHRAAREAEIVRRLERPSTIPELVTAIYAATPRMLWPVAARQVLAHLIALEAEGVVIAETLGRAPDRDEAAILIPDLSIIGDPELVEVARAELGIAAAEREIVRYSLSSSPRT
jgi:glyoxylase-like metal-dependent hydrolase (beta-lactamase superfamily II)